MPRRNVKKFRMGCAPGSGSALKFMGHRPNRGHSPSSRWNWDGGAEPRLTSGGEAAAEGAKFYDWLLIFKTVSHPAAKPQRREPSFMMGS
jgi:hypothetical protein